MSITRNLLRFETQFVQVPNTWVRDKRISRKSRGLLVELMSHSVGWEITVASLVAGGPEGRDAVRGALLELEEAGYLQRVIKKTAKGRFDGVDYELSDPFEDQTPLSGPRSGNPTLENTRPMSGNPTVEIPTLGETHQRTTSLSEHHDEEENGGVGDTVESPAPAKDGQPPWKDLHGNSDGLPASPGRPDRCEFHQSAVSPPPCGSCKEARIAHEAAVKEAKRQEILAERESQEQEIRDRQRAISGCELCDEFGYLNGRPCHHDPEIAERNLRGVKLVREVLRK